MNSNYLLSHYLCSSKSFKSHSFIEPISTSLVRIGVNEEPSKKIVNHIELITIFESVVLYLKKQRASKKITINSLVEANSKLRRKKTAIRDDDCWVGYGENRYTCPVWTELKALLIDFLELVNRVSLSSKELIYIYFKFLAIHPFFDGNGRLARAIFCALSDDNHSLYFCPYLYFTTKNETKFCELVRKSLKTEDEFYRSDEFKVFVSDANKRIEILNFEERSLINKLNSGDISNKKSGKIIQLFLNQPFYEMECFIRILNEKNEFSEKELHWLFNSGALKAQNSKTTNVFIYSPYVTEHIYKHHYLTMKGNSEYEKDKYNN